MKNTWLKIWKKKNLIKKYFKKCMKLININKYTIIFLIKKKDSVINLINLTNSNHQIMQ